MKIIILICVILLTSCSARWHLKQAKKKGAETRIDTVYVEKSIYIPSVKTDTVFESKPGDTIIIQKDRLRMRYVNLPGDTVYLEGECLPDTIRIKIPVTVTNKITVPPSKWAQIMPVLCTILALLLILAIILLLRKVFKPP